MGVCDVSLIISTKIHAKLFQIFCKTLALPVLEVT